MINPLSWLKVLKRSIALRSQESERQQKLNERYWEALMRGDTRAVQALLEQGADIDATNNYRDGYTPLEWLAARGPYHMLSFLVNHGANVNAVGQGGITALMTAAYNGKLDIVKFLVEHGANVNLATKDGSTALSNAYVCRDRRVRSALLAYLKSVGAVFPSGSRAAVVYLQSTKSLRSIMSTDPRVKELTAALRRSTSLGMFDAEGVASGLLVDTDALWPLELTKPDRLDQLKEVCQKYDIDVVVVDAN